MTEVIVELALSVTGTERASLELGLEQAELIAREHAMRNRRGGVLITRTSFTSFTVVVSDQVPFGLTRQCYDW